MKDATLPCTLTAFPAIPPPGGGRAIYQTVACRFEAPSTGDLFNLAVPRQHHPHHEPTPTMCWNNGWPPLGGIAGLIGLGRFRHHLRHPGADRRR